MNNLLLELFGEEIPAKMQLKALANLQEIIIKNLKQQNIASQHVRSYVTPRRMVVYLEDITTKNEAAEKRGPKTSSPVMAIEGFAKSCNVKLEELFIKDHYYYANIQQSDEISTTNLSNIITQSLLQLVWPKSMRWGSHTMRWIRPLSNILCIYNQQVLPVSFGHLSANNNSWGHRFLGEKFFVSLENSFADYQKKLAANYVMLDTNERKNIILQQAEEITKALNIKIRLDEQLLTEVAGLVEFPVVLLAKIDSEFMELPAEVLITAIKTHQKYFLTVKADNSLAEYCLIVSNIKTPDHGKAIIAGNERVLRARLADARFFYQQDLKYGLANMKAKLANIIFHTKVGSMQDKVNQMLALVPLLATDDPLLLEEAMSLAKADLVSEMVNEFPELQGIMGYYYASNAKIASSIRDHYKPVGPDDAIPETTLAALVAIADKITTVVAMFSIGEKPTSSKDPYALRRAAIGIIRIIMEKQLTINLNALITAAANNAQEPVIQEIKQFFLERLKYMLQNMRYDLCNIEAEALDDINKLVNKIKILQNFLATDESAKILAIYKRAHNIVEISKNQGIVLLGNLIKIELFTQESEHKLYNILIEVNNLVDKALQEENYHQALASLADLVAITEDFFSNVLINVAEEELRNNRLQTLTALVALFDKIANFSVI